MMQPSIPATGPSSSASASIRQQLATSARDASADFSTQLANVLDQMVRNPDASPADLVAGNVVSQQVAARQVSLANCIGALGKAWIVFLVAIALLPLLVVLLITKQKSHLVVFVCYLPSIVLFAYAAVKQSATMAIKDLAVRYGFGFCLIFSLVFVMSLLCLLLGFILYAVVVTNVGQIHAAIMYSVIVALCLAVTQESTKLMQTANFFPYLAMGTPAAYVLVNVVVGCGFATAQCIVETIAVLAVVGYYTPIADNHVYGMVVIACLGSIPMHLLAVYHHSMFAARRVPLGHVINKFCFVLVPVLFRAAFLYALYFAPFVFPVDNPYRYVVLGVAPSGTFALYFFVVKLYEHRHMPKDYLESTGYLTFCGLCGWLPAATGEGGAAAPGTSDMVQLQPV